MDEAEWLIEENVEFTTRVKTNYWHRAAIIIDLLAKKVKKNRYSDDKSNEEVIAYFYNKYREQIKSYIVEYMVIYGKEPEIKTSIPNDAAGSVNIEQPQ